jgi:hypothetical protein
LRRFLALRLFHRPLIAGLRGRWALQGDGERLVLYRVFPDSVGCLVPIDAESHRRFLAAAADIARRLPGEFAAEPS